MTAPRRRDDHRRELIESLAVLVAFGLFGAALGLGIRGAAKLAMVVF